MAPEMPFYGWVLFNLFICLLLALDLGIFHRRAHVIHFKEALMWCWFWILLAFLFNLGIYWIKGGEAALKFLAGYLIEESLSIDNIFVFIMLFNAFQIPKLYYHRVLFWGILGALIMRGCFIFGGIALVQRFHWLLLVFGAFLIFTGFRLFSPKTKKFSPEEHPLLRFLRRWVPMTPAFVGQSFFVKENGKWLATPLFIVLILIEITDVLFALDSIPAVMAITLDPFIVYTSNVFAILGLRSIFFAVSGLMELLHYLHYALAAILIFIGIKLIISPFFQIPILITLAFITVSIGLSILASLLLKKE